MNVKSLENRIRGWLPKEPILPRLGAPSQAPKNHKNPRPHASLFLFFPLLSVFFITYGVIFSYSTATLLLFAAILVVAIASLVWLRMSQWHAGRVLKYLVTFILIFAISFTGVEYYLFNYAGYPPAYNSSQPDVTLSYPSMLNASVGQILESLEQGVSFRFLQTEHLGSVTFIGLQLSTPGNGMVRWSFYAKDTNVFITILSAAGHPYYVYTYHNPGVTLPKYYPSAQSTNESFEQIDALGLRWFHDQALQIYQNKNGNKATITDLGVEIEFKSLSNYGDITISLTGRNASYDNFGNRIFVPVFSDEFQPNGTLITSS